MVIDSQKRKYPTPHKITNWRVGRSATPGTPVRPQVQVTGVFLEVDRINGRGNNPNMESLQGLDETAGCGFVGVSELSGPLLLDLYLNGRSYVHKGGYVDHKQGLFVYQLAGQHVVDGPVADRPVKLYPRLTAKRDHGRDQWDRKVLAYIPYCMAYN